MRIDKILMGLALAMLLGSGPAAAADFHTGLKAYRSGDYETALAHWIPEATQNHVLSQAYLGHMYEHGVGVPKNQKTAVKWYTKAAEQGHAKTQKKLGYMFDYGAGVPQNHKTAVKWYTLAAEQGLVGAQYALAYNYEKGIGVATNYKTAIKWYTQSAGFYYSQYRLGDMYFKGLGVAIDYQRAYMWWNLANSTNYFADMGDKEDAAQLMTPEDIAKAKAMSNRCRKSGYTDCGVMAGEAYTCELDTEQTKGIMPSLIEISFNHEKQVTKLYAADYEDYDLERVKVLRYTKDSREIRYTAHAQHENGGTYQAIHTITILPKLSNKITYMLNFPHDSSHYNARGQCEIAELKQVVIKKNKQSVELKEIDPVLAHGIKNDRWVLKLYQEYQSKEGHKALAIASTSTTNIRSLGYASGKTKAIYAMQQAIEECKKYNSTLALCRVADQQAIDQP